MLKICRNIVKVEALKQLRAEGSWTLASPVRVSELLAGDYGHVTSANKLECPVQYLKLGTVFPISGIQEDNLLTS